MRVIAGKAKGRRLQSVPGPGVRPSSDRLKEALFSIIGPDIEGARVLDLYAGSGALGIEALSRGAVEATFVEEDRRAVAMIERNLSSSGLSSSATVVHSTVENYSRGSSKEPFAFVLIDPPYDSGLPSGVLVQLAEGGFLDLDTAVVVEASRRKLPLMLPESFAVDDERVYGDSVLCFLHLRQP